MSRKVVRRGSKGKTGKRAPLTGSSKPVLTKKTIKGTFDGRCHNEREKRPTPTTTNTELSILSFTTEEAA